MAQAVNRTDKALILQVDVSRKPGRTELTAVGEIDASVIGTFEEALRQTIAFQEEQVVVDLSAVQYMDSGCIYALLSAWDALDRRPGALRVRLGSTAAALAFRAAGLERLIPAESEE